MVPHPPYLRTDFITLLLLVWCGQVLLVPSHITDLFNICIFFCTYMRQYSCGNDFCISLPYRHTTKFALVCFERCFVCYFKHYKTDFVAHLWESGVQKSSLFMVSSKDSKPYQSLLLGQKEETFGTCKLFLDNGILACVLLLCWSSCGIMVVLSHLLR